jgi:hypothetical protein
MSRRFYKKRGRRTPCQTPANVRAKEDQLTPSYGNRERLPWPLTRRDSGQAKLNQHLWMEPPVRLDVFVAEKEGGNCEPKEAWATAFMELGQRTIDDVLITAGRPNAQEIGSFLTEISKTNRGGCTCRLRSHRLRVFTDHATDIITPSVADALMRNDIIVLRVPPRYLIPKSRVEYWFASLNRRLLERLPTQPLKLNKGTISASLIESLPTPAQLQEIIQQLDLDDPHFPPFNHGTTQQS